jgi:hypothetical protein
MEEEKSGNADISEREELENRPESVETPESGKEKSQPEEDPRFAGKSAEELKSIIREQEKHIGRQGNALGEVQSLKQSMAELRDYVIQSSQVRERHQPQPEPQGPEFDLTDPGPYVANIAAQIVNQREQQRMAADQQRYMSEAQINYYEGRESAMGQNPELFDGIEGAVEQAVKQSFANGVISAPMLRSPKTWAMAAKVLRIERGEDEKIITRRSVKAVESEKPGRSVSLEDEDIVLDAEDREEARRMGISEKEAKENIRVALEARKRGLQVDRRN